MTDAEIERIADKCGMYDCHDNGRINGNTLLDFARAILAAQPAQTGHQPDGSLIVTEQYARVEMMCVQSGAHSIAPGTYPLYLGERQSHD